MKVSELFNERILVEDVVIESVVSEGGVIHKSPTLKDIMDEMKKAAEFKREQTLFVSDIVFKIVKISDKHPTGLKEGDLIHSISTGNFTFLTSSIGIT